MRTSSVGSGAGPPSESLLRALGLDALAEREPEAVAASRALLHVGLRSGLLLARERLGVREADAPAALFDREHEYLELAVHGEGLAQIGAAARGELCGGHEPGLTRPEAHEDAERFVPLDPPGEDRAHLNARLHLLPELGALGRPCQRDATLRATDPDQQHDHPGAGAGGRGCPQRPRTAPRNRGDVQKAIDARQELDEAAELGRAPGAPAFHLPLAQPSRHRGPRIALERLQAERDPALLLVDPDDLDGHGIADAQEVGGAAPAPGRAAGEGARPPPHATMSKSAQARARRTAPRQYRAGQDLLPGLLGRLGGALLQDLSAGEDQVAAVLAEGHHAELEHAADVLLAGLG